MMGIGRKRCWWGVMGMASICLLACSGALADPGNDVQSVAAMVSVEYRPAIMQRLGADGENRRRLMDAIAGVPAAHRDAMAFLVANMPEGDLGTLNAAMLSKNVELAFEAREKHAWAKAVPEEIFLDAVLPYANLNERRDDWREDFVKRFAPLVKNCTSAGDAAQVLNREIFKILNVQYHATKRKKPDQSPYESMQVGYASCTGLSILLANACRAVGVPARVVGCARWADDSGNHTWVEIWDGQWWFVGAAEPGKFNEGWFTEMAAKANDADPQQRIHAASFKKTSEPFILTWAPRRREFSAVDVTRYYAHRQMIKVGVVGSDGEAAPAGTMIRLVQGGQTIGQVAGASAEFEVAAGMDYEVRAAAGTLVRTSAIHVPADADAGMELRLTTMEEAPVLAGPLSAAPVEATPGLSMSSVPSAVDELRAWLGKAKADRGELAVQGFAKASLSKSEAAEAQKMLWEDHAAEIRAKSEGEWKEDKVSAAGKTMLFLRKNFGTKPESGWDLYISMHGGGNAAAAVNDSQWKNQIKLYQPPNSLYIAPRAPTNTWNLWHEAHIDALFDRMIQEAIVLEGVNPNRVYIMGYSAGGDGVYQLAPRMADHLAAASMMAGHPNDASPLGLRNIGFTIHVGALDNGYDRNKVAGKWGGLLDDLQKEDPKGYVHEVKVHEGRAHWMNLEDAVAVGWMGKFTRDPLPEKIVWKQASVTHDSFYWLAMVKDGARAGQLVVAGRVGQKIEIEKAEDVGRLRVRVSDAMVDMDQPVVVCMKGKELFKGVVPRTIGVIAGTIAERGDPGLVFSGEVEVKVGEAGEK